MAMTPNSVVHFLNVPLENDYKHQIYFDDGAKQIQFFLSKKKYTFDNLTYQRKDEYIRVPKHIDDLNNCNYVMYQNTNYRDKWFYAFITKKEYINDGTTHVYIETDVFQTYLFDFMVKKSFVEREHVMDDTFGLHTIPENLETGEYTCNEKTDDEKMKQLAIYIAFSDYANDKIDVVGNKYNGIYSGMGYRIFPNKTEAILQINEFLNGYDDNAKADAINSLFMCPAFLGVDDDEDPANFESHQVNPTTSPKFYMIEKEFQKTLDGYTPKNKKLLTYPYNYLYVSNNSGGTALYKYENFKIDKCRFYINGCLTPGGSIRLQPHDYKKLGIINNDEGLNAGKFPICCWNSDTYTNWLAQNGRNIALNIVSGGIQMVTGGAYGVVGGIQSIASTLTQVHQQSMIPDQVKGNTNCGDVISANGENTFMFYKMSIKREFAEIIDEYFEVYGYKVNKFKIPNLNGRPYWNYVKTIDVNIDGGDIPNEDMSKLKSIFDNGVTLWKNGNYVGDYSMDNH